MESLDSFSAIGFFIFFDKNWIYCFQRFLLKFLVQNFYLLRYCEDIGVQTLPCPSFKITPRIWSLRTDYVYQCFFKSNFERFCFLKILLPSYFHINLSLSYSVGKQDALEPGQVDMAICCWTARWINITHKNTRFFWILLVQMVQDATRYVEYGPSQLCQVFIWLIGSITWFVFRQIVWPHEYV